MNFFGHALVAAYKKPDPPFVLGSMLPDFAAMLHLRLPAVRAALVREGVAFHHATDRAFHESRAFRTLNLDASRHLNALGVRRGTVRAVAHVGVEYMIDGELAGLLGGKVADYQAALGHGASLEPGALFSGSGEHARFARLLDGLAQRGVSAFTGNHGVLVARLVRALQNRPRLTISDEDLPRVDGWARSQAAAVAGAVPALLSELAEALEVPLPPSEIH